jgi:ATP-dependent RNA helicase DDX19/DBP5
VLISTNVLARGIDVPQVDVVINYDVPTVQINGWKSPDFANYMHRVGRTGRFGTDGLALTFINREDENEPEFVKKIAEEYSIDIDELKSFKEFKDIYVKMRKNQDGDTV